MVTPALPVLPDALEFEEIAEKCRVIHTADTRGELGILLSDEVMRFSMFDLQVIGGTMRNEISKLPSPYREAVAPYFMVQIFGMHHHLISESLLGNFVHINSPIKDKDLFERFCDMVPHGCFSWDERSENRLTLYRPRYRLFYYLIACYTMFVRECPGHPVGMPFPGSLHVEKKQGIFFCPIRDKEKDVVFSICNFCPAVQSESPETQGRWIIKLD